MAQREQALLNGLGNVSSSGSEHSGDDSKDTAAPGQTTKVADHEARLLGQRDAGRTALVLKNSAYLLKGESIQLADTKTNRTRHLFFTSDLVRLMS